MRWVAVVTGIGSAFCTGADLSSFIPELTGDQPRPTGWDNVDAVHAVLHRFPVYKPIVAAVNGLCVAGGRRCSVARTSGLPLRMHGSP